MPWPWCGIGPCECIFRDVKDDVDRWLRVVCAWAIMLPLLLIAYVPLDLVHVP